VPWKIKKLHDPTNHGSSNHRDCHDATWGVASPCERGPKGRTNGSWDGAPVEDAPEEGIGTAMVGVYDASLLLPPASWGVAALQSCCHPCPASAAHTEEEMQTRDGLRRLGTPRSRTRSCPVSVTRYSRCRPRYHRSQTAPKGL
jgi:hypothetical protein